MNIYDYEICTSCINFCDDCKEKDVIERVVDGVTIKRCRNYHKWSECIETSCRKCGKCKGSRG